ncbi:MULTISPECIES: Yip1 family protein [Rhodanobacter]|uniref:Yip1 family protein n=1 Tax=Rhodanobacter TaxID=75309 RepID=UPI000406E9FD|nr:MULTISPECIES: Yip1 family protein [Rhodanobacter]UJJ55145.1 YIP1 family protein [Rhodanobacter thiooxydans]
MGIAGMLLHYVLALVPVYVVALIVNALAPTFGGEKDMNQALKAVAYAWTASRVAGSGVIGPWLGLPIVLIGGVYSIYLLYLGLPHTIKCPPEKAGGYAAVSVISATVLGWIVGLVVAGVIGTAALTGAAVGGMHVTGSSGAGGFMSLASAMAPEEEKQTEHGYEKTYGANGNLVHEEWDTQSKYGE